MWLLIIFVKFGKIVFLKRIEKFIFYVIKKNIIYDNIIMYFIGGRGRVGFVKELKVVNLNKE